ncbi:MAG: hypothetical protein RLZZ628_515 [Bacteroidota bacterium]|jgi:hypothetical protein
MSDQIEDWIAEHRAALDTKAIPKGLWDRIQNNLDEKVPATRLIVLPKPTYKSWYRAAAAAILLLGVGMGAGWWMRDNQRVTPTTIASNMKFSDDLITAEKFYDEKINIKVAELEARNPDPSVMADLKQLDEVQIELRHELEIAPRSSHEEILKTLMENYQNKLSILERVLEYSEQNVKNKSNRRQNESL